MAAVFLSSFALAVAILGLLLGTRIAWRIATDVPNGRSLHATPIPRAGGWGLVPAVLVSVVIFGATNWLLLGLAVALFISSYMDDRTGLPVAVRLSIHAAAAVALLAWGPFDLPIALALPAAIGLVWIANLFNFMDGADGLAGGMAVFAFSVYAAVAASSGPLTLAYWSIAFAGASAGFLLFNFNPARVFLGDAGSVTVGFFAGAFGVWGWAANAWPFWFPFLVSAPFFVDASLTLARRVALGEEFWKAHREHYYQRLIRSGWSHRRTAVCEYLVMACSALLAVTMLDWSPYAQYAGLGGAAVVYVLIAYAIERRWARYNGAARDDSVDSHEARGDAAAGNAPTLAGMDSATPDDDVIAYARRYDRPGTANKA